MQPAPRKFAQFSSNDSNAFLSGS